LLEHNLSRAISVKNHASFSLAPFFLPWYMPAFRRRFSEQQGDLKGQNTIGHWRRGGRDHETPSRIQNSGHPA
jgi:hypothetical protein